MDFPGNVPIWKNVSLNFHTAFSLVCFRYVFIYCIRCTLTEVAVQLHFTGTCFGSMSMGNSAVKNEVKRLLLDFLTVIINILLAIQQMFLKLLSTENIQVKQLHVALLVFELILQSLATNY